MRILHMAHSLGRGGAETLLLHLCRLQKASHSVHVLTDLGGTLEKDFYDVLDSGLQKKHRSIRTFARYILDLRKYLISNQIQVIHSHTAGDALFGWIASWGLSIPVVDTHHGFRLSSRWMSRLVTKCMLSRVSCNVFVSKAQQSVYLKSLAKNYPMRVVYNGVHFPDEGTFERGGFRKELGFEPSERLFGMVGNFGNAVRNPMVICKALNLLKSMGKLNFHFVFIGARNPSAPWFFDDCMDFCRENELLERVHFVGARADVQNILVEMDAFVYSTREDTFGIGVVEAQGANLPLIVNNHPVMQEILDSRSTIFYPSEDHVSLAQILMEWSPCDSNILSEVSRDCRARFSLARCAEAYQNLYSEVWHAKA